MKKAFTIIFSFFSLMLNAQKWELVVDENITDIASFGETLYIVGSQGSSSNRGEVFFGVSHDGGLTWSKVILNPYITVQGGPISVGFFNDKEGIIGIKGSYTKQYLKTVDGGLTWEVFTPNLPEDCFVPQPFDFTRVNESVGIISQFQSGNYLITRDRGNTWSCNRSFTTSWLPNFTGSDQTVFFNFDEDGLYKTSDGGVTWSLVLEKWGLRTYEMHDKQIGYAISENDRNIDSNDYILYRTQDGWNNVETHSFSIDSDWYVHSIAPVDSENLFIFAADDIYHSTDGGISFSFLQSLNGEPYKIKKINNQWYATGRGLVKYNPNGVVTSTSGHILPPSRIFPNPVTNSRIELNADFFDRYEIFTLSGVLVEEGRIDQREILLSPSLNGAYILKIQDRSQSREKTFRIIFE